MKYLSWNETTITDFSEKNISEMYENGYVFTRKLTDDGKRGVMQQTRSVRIDLSKFELLSENRRILKKVPELVLETLSLPLANYDYSIGKLAKDFYESKFGPGIMSAQKIKMMLTDKEQSNFNRLLRFTGVTHLGNNQDVTHPGTTPLGYAICFASSRFIHYSYPFYALKSAPKDMGMGMMIKAVLHAKETGLDYIYLGSLQRPGDTYKLQFSGLEWFDGQKWSCDLEEVKGLLGRLE